MSVQTKLLRSCFLGLGAWPGPRQSHTPIRFTGRVGAWGLPGMLPGVACSHSEVLGAGRWWPTGHVAVPAVAAGLSGGCGGVHTEMALAAEPKPGFPGLPKVL